MPDGRVTVRRGQRIKRSGGSEIRETGAVAEWPACTVQSLDPNCTALGTGALPLRDPYDKDRQRASVHR